MRGRKKHAATNYKPQDDLFRAESMARFGKFHDEAIWGWVLRFATDLRSDPKATANFYRENPSLCPKMMIREWCDLLLRTGAPRGFVKLGEMMEAAQELAAQGRESVEPERVALLKANEEMYVALSEAGKHKAEVKKADLVKRLWTKYPTHFAEKDQSDILKMMRKMGLPRRPLWLVPGYLEKIKKEIAAFYDRKANPGSLEILCRHKSGKQKKRPRG